MSEVGRDFLNSGRLHSSCWLFVNFKQNAKNHPNSLHSNNILSFQTSEMSKCHNFTQLCKTSSLSLDFINFIWIEWKHTYTLLSNIIWWHSVPKHCSNDLKCHQGSPCTVTGDTFEGVPLWSLNTPKSFKIT